MIPVTLVLPHVSARYKDPSLVCCPVTPVYMRTLADVRCDLVHTIQQVVDGMSKYMGGVLPEPARM